MPYSEYDRLFRGNHPARSIEHRWELLFSCREQFDNAMHNLNPEIPYKWEWKWIRKDLGIYGYEVTSRGDRRFSPFFQRVQFEGKEITAEKYWELVIKPMTDRRGTAHEFWTDYLNDHLGLFYELAVIGLKQPLTDMFDRTGGQNMTYCDILNNYFKL